MKTKMREYKRLLRRAAEKRGRQAAKHGVAGEYLPGQQVWVKLHQRSDASRRLTRKIHLVYQGPYKVLRVIRRNAYLIADRDENPIGVHNSRQLRPYRGAMLSTRDRWEELVDREVMRINEIRINQGKPVLQHDAKRKHAHNEKQNKMTKNKKIETIRRSANNSLKTRPTTSQIGRWKEDKRFTGDDPNVKPNERYTRVGGRMKGTDDPQTRWGLS